MIHRRLATAFVFLPILAVGLFTEVPGRLVLTVTVAACSVWGLSEFFNLAGRIGAAPPRLWIYFTAAAAALLVYGIGSHGLRPVWLAAWSITAVIGVLVSGVVSGRVDHWWVSFMASIAGPVYVAVPLLLALSLRQAEHGAWYLWFAFLVTWLSDTGAFFGGRAFGRRKLCPAISPGKTWEGSVSGTLLAVLGIWLAGWIQFMVRGASEGARFFWTRGDTSDIVALTLLAVILVVTGTVGDLAESMLKRNLGVKDSGSPLTGHGGFLDIMDSLLVNFPLVFLYALLVEGL
jgi:phosphatidate cytidylyltransferase